MKKNLFLVLFAAIAIVFSSCSKDDDKDDISLKSYEISIYSGDKYQIEATSNKTISYLSENTYHATVSTSGLVKADKVGETVILLSNGEDTKEFKVTVKPKSNLYPEPILEWGMTKNNLINKLGNPNADSGDIIRYDNYSSSAPIVMYMFENNKLTSTNVMVKTAYSSELGTFLAERYVPVASENYTIYFTNNYNAEKVSMVIGANLYNTSFWMTIYIATNRTSKSIRTSNDKSYMESINRIMESYTE